MTDEQETADVNKVYLEVISMDEIGETMFLEEILSEYNKIYELTEEGIKIERILEYKSESGCIYSLNRMNKILLYVKYKDGTFEYQYVRNPRLIDSVIMNLINRMEMKQGLQFK